MAYELRFLVPTLACLGLALVGFALRQPKLALPAAALGGVLVASFGGLGHFLPFGILYPIRLFDGPGGVLVGVNAAVGLALAIVALGAFWAELTAMT